MRDHLPVGREVRPPARHRAARWSMQQVPRPAQIRRGGCAGLPRGDAVRAALGLGRRFAAAAESLAPRRCRPPRRRAWPAPRHARRMIALAGCVQPSMRPSINAPPRGCSTGWGFAGRAGAGCCGAVRFHLDDQDGGRDDARRNIDAWWPEIGRERSRPSSSPPRAVACRSRITATC